MEIEKDNHTYWENEAFHCIVRWKIVKGDTELIGFKSLLKNTYDHQKTKLADNTLFQMFKKILLADDERA